MRIDWSPPALADLQSISEHIEQDRDLDTANRVARAIYDAVQTLRRMPRRGRRGRVEGTRELVLPRLPYVVVYQVSVDRVIVLSVVHGAQRWP